MRVAVVLATVVCLGCGGSTQGTTGDGGSQCLNYEYQPAQSGGWAPVCSTPASREVVRTQCGDVTERCTTGGVTAPALSCVTTPPGAEPGTPATVTLTGFAMVFSSGGDSKNITVKVYSAAAITTPEALDSATPIGTYTTALPATGTPADGDVRACPTEDENKVRLLGCVSPSSAGCVPKCGDAVNGAEFCYVAPGQTAGTCIERSRYEPRYTIPNVPTRTPLLIVTTGPGGKTDLVWSMMVQQNEYVSTNAPECGAGVVTNCFHDKAGASPSYELNVNALSRGDYSSIAVTAGLSQGIPPGHGGIAGEVRDCDDIRLQYAQVGVSPAPTQLKYFNGDQWNTLPVAASEGTCRLGLYTALDLPPGKAQIEAYGLVGGQVVSLGWYSAMVFPDAVTIASINTGKPLPATP
ncbi:MAG TPA: hypothetical protein VGQ83_22215 [Polyangia bacterium]|jgi:hypothetical protein